MLSLLRKITIPYYAYFTFFFFFQAEDGIRDLIVTGVQTCALPISIQPVPARPRLVGDGERGAFRLELPDQLVDVALSRADHPQRHHLRTAVLCRVGHGNGVLVNIETDEERLARLTHG